MNILIDQALPSNGYMQTTPSLKPEQTISNTNKRSILLIDYPFLYKEIKTTLNLLAEDYPGDQFERPKLEDLILNGIRALYQTGIVTVVIFHDDNSRHELSHLNGKVLKYSDGEAHINTCCHAEYSVTLCNHMTAYGHLYDEVLLMGDDQIYIPPMLDALSYSKVKLLRRDNERTLYQGTQLTQVHWQDIYYVIGMALGLHEYEM